MNQLKKRKQQAVDTLGITTEEITKDTITKEMS